MWRQTNNARTSQESGTLKKEKKSIFFCSHRDSSSFSVLTLLPIFHIINERRVSLFIHLEDVCNHNLWNPSWEPSGLFELFISLHNIQLFWLRVMQPGNICKVHQFLVWSWVTKAPISHYRILGICIAWGVMCRLRLQPLIIPPRNIC